LPPICRHLQLIGERDRMGLAAGTGYNWRALVEADIGRYKRVIGDALRSRTGGRQMTEVAIAAASLKLNRMLELGRPEYVRLTYVAQGADYRLRRCPGSTGSEPWCKMTMPLYRSYSGRGRQLPGAHNRRYPERSLIPAGV
jgi:hypothetical protein